MIIRNSLKTLGDNFIVVWKQLLYFIIVGLIVALVTALTLTPVIEIVNASGWKAEFAAFVENSFASFKGFAGGLTSLIVNLLEILKNSASLVWGSYVALILLVVFSFFSVYVAEFVCGKLIYGKMESLRSQSYVQNLFTTFGRSSRYALIKLLVSLPFYALIGCTLWLYATLASALKYGLLLLPALLLLLILIFAVRDSLLSSFLARAVSGSGKVFGALAQSIKEDSKQFWRFFQARILLNLVCLAIIVASVLFTALLGLIVVFPAMVALTASYSFVTLNIDNKHKFYVNDSTIVSPL